MQSLNDAYVHISDKNVKKVADVSGHVVAEIDLWKSNVASGAVPSV
jgi:hypothetical protein